VHAVNTVQMEKNSPSQNMRGGGGIMRPKPVNLRPSQLIQAQANALEVLRLEPDDGNRRSVWGGRGSPPDKKTAEGRNWITSPVQRLELSSVPKAYPCTRQTTKKGLFKPGTGKRLWDRGRPAYSIVNFRTLKPEMGGKIRALTVAASTRAVPWCDWAALRPAAANMSSMPTSANAFICSKHRWKKLNTFPTALPNWHGCSKKAGQQCKKSHIR